MSITAAAHAAAIMRHLGPVAAVASVKAYLTRSMYSSFTCRAAFGHLNLSAPLYLGLSLASSVSPAYSNFSQFATISWHLIRAARSFGCLYCHLEAAHGTGSKPPVCVSSFQMRVPKKTPSAARRLVSCTLE